MNQEAVDTTSAVEHKPGIRYVCAVQRKPYVPPIERAERERKRQEIALAFGLFLYPALMRGRLNLQPFEVRHAAALKAEAPHEHTERDCGCCPLPRDVKRERRRAANRRKARRGWR